MSQGAASEPDRSVPLPNLVGETTACDIVVVSAIRLAKPRSPEEEVGVNAKLSPDFSSQAGARELGTGKQGPINGVCVRGTDC